MACVIFEINMIRLRRSVAWPAYSYSLLQVEFRRLFVGLSVCPLVTSVYRAKTADSIDMPFGVVNWVAPRNQALDGVQIFRVRGKF